MSEAKRRYTEADKALALEVLARSNGVVTLDVIRDVRAVLNAPDLPKMTIYRWSQADVTHKNIASPEAKEQAKLALDDLFEKAARAYVDHSLKDDVILKATAAQAMTAAAIAVDKMRLLRDLPTEIVRGVVEFVEVAKKRGYDPMEAIRALINEMDTAPLTVGAEGDSA